MRYLFLLAVLAACGASSKVTVAPDGRWAYQISCREAGDCLAEAGRLCPKGYKTFAAGERSAGAVAQSLGNVAVATPVTEVVMAIRCQGALGGAPTD